MPVCVDSYRLAPSPARRGDVDSVATVPANAPVRSRGSMRQHGIWAACEDRSHPVPVRGEQRMSYGVDPLMHTMESPRFNSLVDQVSTKTEPLKLPKPNHPMLPLP